MSVNTQNSSYDTGNARPGLVQVSLDWYMVTPPRAVRPASLVAGTPARNAQHYTAVLQAHGVADDVQKMDVDSLVEDLD